MGGLDLDLGADLKAHRLRGVEHDSVPDTAYWPAMPCDLGGVNLTSEGVGLHPG